MGTWGLPWTLLLAMFHPATLAIEVGGVNFGLPKFGWCPTLPAQRNFVQHIDKFLGLWYVQSAHGLEALQGKARCIIVNYSKKLDHKTNKHFVYVQSRQFHEDNNRWEGLNGEANRLNEKSLEGKFTFKFSIPVIGELSDTYTIIESDFENYSVVHGCGVIFAIFRYECCWLMSRKRILTPKEEKEFYKITEKALKKYTSLDPKEFTKVDQTKCDFSATIGKSHRDYYTNNPENYRDKETKSNPESRWDKETKSSSENHRDKERKSNPESRWDKETKSSPENHRDKETKSSPENRRDKETKRGPENYRDK